MCVGPFAPKAPPAPPALPPLPPPLAPPPTLVSPDVGEARKREQRRAALAGGSKTVLTTPQGLLTEATTAPKTLLGT